MAEPEPNRTAVAGGTPEIVRTRRLNIQRNAVRWNAIGLSPTAGAAGASSGRSGGTSSSSGGGGGGGREGRGGGGSLLSGAVAAAAAGGGAGKGRERGGVGGGGGGGGGGHGHRCALVPLDVLVKRWPGREEQIAELAGLIGESTDGVPVPPLIITGPPCCGKTSVVRAVLEHRGCTYAYVNCAEVFRRKDLLEAVVEQVAGGSWEDILMANRVDRSFRSAAARDPEESSVPGPEGVSLSGGEGGIAGMNDDDHHDNEEDDANLQQQQQKPTLGKRRQPQRPKCSSWNVFYRQLAALLARRSSTLGRDSCHESSTTGSGGGIGDGGSGGGGGGCGCGVSRRPPEFPPKLFVVLDNAEALLSESVAGIGVGAGGSGTTGNLWRGQDMLTSLASLQGMVDSLSGFAGMRAPLATDNSQQHQQQGQQQRPRACCQRDCQHHLPPPVCPILISQNGFFASDVMGGRGGAGDWRSAGGRHRSLVASVCPVQLRFPPYSKEHLPDVLTAIAHRFGLDLNVDLRAAGGGPVESRTAAGNKAGRNLFRKMAAALVSTLKNETSDAWELGVEAARMWPHYKRSAEDGCFDAQLTAALKPLLRDAAKCLHGFGGMPGDRDSSIGSSLKNTGNNSNSRDSSANTSRSSSSRSSNRKKPSSLGLSRSAKHLLVSAYLASHNSRDTDRDMFTAKSTRKSKRQKGVRSKAGNAEDLVEAGVQDLPEAREFQLERLLSIMSSIVAVTEVGTKAANSMGSTELFAQVTVPLLLSLFLFLSSLLLLLLLLLLSFALLPGPINSLHNNHNTVQQYVMITVPSFAPSPPPAYIWFGLI
ncbi:unnamed protein product [Pylaiella littoralis]